MNSEFEATPVYNIDYSIAHARARGTYFYEIKFLRLKENSYNSQKFCTLKITRCTVFKNKIESDGIQGLTRSKRLYSKTWCRLQ